MTKNVFDTKAHSPIYQIKSQLFDQANVTLFVKREDLLHPTISGNKWRKLKYNLKNALDNNIETIITFGGAFSNHIYSTAAACHAIGIKSVGIIRGDFDDNNPTTKFARKCGMQLHFIDRTTYKEKEKSNAVKSILSKYINYKIIPEGGSNTQAQKGLKELSDEINETQHNIILVSAGTGSTAKGILANLKPNKELWVFSSLKSDYLKSEILTSTNPDKHKQFKFFSNYHYGGYGRTSNELIRFINDFKVQTGVPLDPIYNGKLISGFHDLVQQKNHNTKDSYLWIHTGGLQGIDAYNYIAQKKNKPIIEK